MGNGGATMQIIYSQTCEFGYFGGRGISLSNVILVKAGFLYSRRMAETELPLATAGVRSRSRSPNIRNSPCQIRLQHMLDRRVADGCLIHAPDMVWGISLGVWKLNCYHIETSIQTALKREVGQLKWDLQRHQMVRANWSNKSEIRDLANELCLEYDHPLQPMHHVIVKFSGKML
jgi:hypothetical protein